MREMLTPVNLHISNCQYKIKQAGGKCRRYSSVFFLSWTNFTVRNSDIFPKSVLCRLIWV